jgi:CheY-like chemotaxis protein
MNPEPTILLVDDSEGDRCLMSVAFKKAQFNRLFQAVGDGEEALAYLKGVGVYSDRNQFPLPAVILLDLNMPKLNGFEVLQWWRAETSLRRLSMIVLTTSLRAEDVERAFDFGASGFLVKPATLDELVSMMRRLRDWLEINHFPPHNFALR